MKTILLITVSIFFILNSQGQITKGNWLVGGNMTFSNTKSISTTSLGVGSYTSINLGISPNIGYFLLDKFALGLKPSFTHQKFFGGEVINNGVAVASYGVSNMDWFDIGPFVRYYFLPVEKNINIFSEINYKYGIANLHPGKGDRNSYSIYVGPVVYFNSSVGIEFSVGYNSSRETLYGLNSSTDDVSLKNKRIEMGIGLQIHLEK